MKKSLPTPRTKLRGFFHQEIAPLAIAAGIILVCLAPNPTKKFGSIVYLISSTILFTISAIYHSFNWSNKVKTILRKIDHSNVFLLIAGTNTPIIISYLPPKTSKILLIIIWSLVVLGILFHVFFVDSHRLLQISIYIFLGAFGFGYLPYILDHYKTTGAKITAIMIIVGCILYIIGAVFYALKWPGKNAKIFGFHELFHIFTILAFACHCIGIYYAVLT